jgi:hypothetical protein
MFHLIWYILIGLIGGVITKSVMHAHIPIFWKLSIVLLGLAPFICLYQASAQTTPKESATAVKAMTMTCTVSADEKRIVTANDNKSWTVANPKTLKGHAGDYISITAEFDASKNRATVKGVKVLDRGAVNKPKTRNDKDNDTPLVR